MAPAGAGRVNPGTAGTRRVGATVDVHVQAAVRLRPLPANITGRAAGASCCRIIDAHSLAIVGFSAAAAETQNFVPSARQEEEHFSVLEDGDRASTDREEKHWLDLTFNGGVFGEGVDTSTVYLRTVQPFVVQLSEGVSSVIVLQGATNSGKSFCCFGTLDHPGLSFLALQDLFSHIASYKDKDSKANKPETETPSLLPWSNLGDTAWGERDYEFAVRCSLVEIREGKLVDLLSCCTKGLSVTETFPTLVLQRVCSSKAFAVAGLNEIDLTSTAEALPLLAKAAAVKKARDSLLATPSCSLLSITVEKATTTPAEAVARTADASVLGRGGHRGEREKAAAGTATSGAEAAKGERARGCGDGEREGDAERAVMKGDAESVDETSETPTTDAVEVTEATLHFVVLEGFDATAVPSLNQVLHNSGRSSTVGEEDEKREAGRGDDTLSCLLDQAFVADANLCVIATADASAENLRVSLPLLQRTALYSGVLKKVRQKMLAPEESRLHSIHRVLVDQYQQRRQLLQVLQEKAAKQLLISASLLEARQEQQWWGLSAEELHSKIAALERDLEATRRKLLLASDASWRLLEASRTSVVLYILSCLRHRRFLVEVLKEERRQPRRPRLALAASVRTPRSLQSPRLVNGDPRFSTNGESLPARGTALFDRDRRRWCFSAASPALGPGTAKSLEPMPPPSSRSSLVPDALDSALPRTRGTPTGRRLQRREARPTELTSGTAQQPLQQQEGKSSYRHTERTVEDFTARRVGRQPAAGAAPAAAELRALQGEPRASALKATGETICEETHVFTPAAGASSTCPAAAASSFPSTAAGWQPKPPPVVRVVNISQQQRQLLMHRAPSRPCGAPPVLSRNPLYTTILPQVWSAPFRGMADAFLSPVFPSSSAAPSQSPVARSATSSAGRWPRPAAAAAAALDAAPKGTSIDTERRPPSDAAPFASSSPASRSSATDVSTEAATTTSTAAAAAAATSSGADAAAIPATAGNGEGCTPAARPDQRYETSPVGERVRPAATAAGPLAANAAVTRAATSAAPAHFVAPCISPFSTVANANSSVVCTAPVAPGSVSHLKGTPQASSYHARYSEATRPCTLPPAAATATSFMPAPAPTAAAVAPALSATSASKAPAEAPVLPVPAGAPGQAAAAAPAETSTPARYHVAAAPPCPSATAAFVFQSTTSRQFEARATAAATSTVSLAPSPLTAAAGTSPVFLSLASPNNNVGTSYAGGSFATPEPHAAFAAAPMFLSATCEHPCTASVAPFTRAAATVSPSWSVVGTPAPCASPATVTSFVRLPTALHAAPALPGGAQLAAPVATTLLPAASSAAAPAAAAFGPVSAAPAAAPAAALWSPPAFCVAASPEPPVEKPLLQATATGAPTSPAAPLFFGVLAVSSSNRQESAPGTASELQQEETPSATFAIDSAAGAALPTAFERLLAKEMSSKAASLIAGGGVSTQEGEGCCLPTSDPGAAASRLPTVPAAPSPPADAPVFSLGDAAAAASVSSAGDAVFRGAHLSSAAVETAAASPPPAAVLAGAVPAAAVSPAAALSARCGQVSLISSHVPDAVVSEEEDENVETAGGNEEPEKERCLHNETEMLACSNPKPGESRVWEACCEKISPHVSNGGCLQEGLRFYSYSRISNSSGRSSGKCCCSCCNSSVRDTGRQRRSAMQTNSQTEDHEKHWRTGLSEETVSAAVQELAVALEKLQQPPLTGPRQPRRRGGATTDELRETDTSPRSPHGEAGDKAGQSPSSNCLWSGSCCGSDTEAPSLASKALFATTAQHGSPLTETPTVSLPRAAGAAPATAGMANSLNAAADALLSDFLGATTDSPLPTATDDGNDPDDRNFLHAVSEPLPATPSPPGSRLPTNEGRIRRKQEPGEPKEEKEDTRQQQQQSCPAAALGAERKAAKERSATAAGHAEAHAATPVVLQSTATSSSSGGALLQHATQLQDEILDLLHPDGLAAGGSVQSRQRDWDSPATASFLRSATSPFNHRRREEQPLLCCPPALLQRSCTPSSATGRATGCPSSHTCVSGPACGNSLQKGVGVASPQCCENFSAGWRALPTHALAARRRKARNSICLRLSVEPGESALEPDDPAAADSSAAGRSSRSAEGGIALVGTPTEIRFSLAAAEDGAGRPCSVAAAAQSPPDVARDSDFYTAAARTNGAQLNGATAVDDEEVRGVIRRRGGESWEVRYASKRLGDSFCLPERRPGDPPAWAQSKQQLYFRQTLRPWNRDSTPAVTLRGRPEPCSRGRSSAGRRADAGGKAAAARRRFSCCGCKRSPANCSTQQETCCTCHCCACDRCSRQMEGDASSGEEAKDAEMKRNQRSGCKAAEAAAEETARKFRRERHTEGLTGEEEESERKIRTTAEEKSIGDIDGSHWTSPTAEDTRHGAYRVFGRQRCADTLSGVESSTTNGSAAGRAPLSSAQPLRVEEKDRETSAGGGSHLSQQPARQNCCSCNSGSSSHKAETARASQGERLRAMYCLPSGTTSSNSSSPRGGDGLVSLDHSQGRSTRCSGTVERRKGGASLDNRREPQEAESADGHSARASPQSSKRATAGSVAALPAEQLPPTGAGIFEGKDGYVSPSSSGLPSCSSNAARRALFCDPPSNCTQLQQPTVSITTAAAVPRSACAGRKWRPPALQDPPRKESPSHLRQGQQPLHGPVCASPPPASALRHATYSSAASPSSAVYNSTSFNSPSSSSAFRPLDLGAASSQRQEGSDLRHESVSAVAEANKQERESQPDTPTFGRSNPAGGIPLRGTAADRTSCPAFLVSGPGPANVVDTSSSVLGSSYFSNTGTGNAATGGNAGLLGSAYRPSTVSAVDGMDSYRCSSFAYYPGWGTEGISDITSGSSCSSYTDAVGGSGGRSYSDSGYKVICTIRRHANGVPMDLSPASPLQERSRTIYPLSHISEYSVVGDATDASLLHPSSASVTTPETPPYGCYGEWRPPTAAHPSVGSPPAPIRFPAAARDCASGSPQLRCGNSEGRVHFGPAGASSYVDYTAAVSAGPAPHEQCPSETAAEGCRAADNRATEGCTKACKGAEEKVSPCLERHFAANLGRYPGSAGNPILLGPLPGPDRVVDFSSLYAPTTGASAAAAAPASGSDKRDSCCSQSEREEKTEVALKVEDNTGGTLLGEERKEGAATQEAPKEQTLWDGMVGFLGERVRRFWEERKKPEAPQQQPQRPAASRVSSRSPFVQSTTSGGVQFERRYSSARKRRSVSPQRSSVRNGGDGPVQTRRGGEEAARGEYIVASTPTPQSVTVSAFAGQTDRPAQANVQLSTPQLLHAPQHHLLTPLPWSAPPLTTSNSALLQGAGQGVAGTILAPAVSMQSYPAIPYDVPVARVHAPPGSVVLTGDAGEVTTTAGATGALVAAPASDSPGGALLTVPPSSVCAPVGVPPGMATPNTCILPSLDAYNYSGLAAAAAPHSSFPLNATLLIDGEAAGGGAATAVTPVAPICAAISSPSAPLPSCPPPSVSLLPAVAGSPASVGDCSPAGSPCGAAFAAVSNNAASPLTTPPQFATMSAGPAEPVVVPVAAMSPSPLLRHGNTTNITLGQGINNELQGAPAAVTGSAAGTNEPEAATGGCGARCVLTPPPQSPTGAPAGVAPPAVAATLQPSLAESSQETLPTTVVPASAGLGAAPPAPGVAMSTPNGSHFARSQLPAANSGVSLPAAPSAPVVGGSEATAGTYLQTPAERMPATGLGGGGQWLVGQQQQVLVPQTNVLRTAGQVAPTDLRFRETPLTTPTSNADASVAPAAADASSPQLPSGSVASVFVAPVQSKVAVPFGQELRYLDQFSDMPAAIHARDLPWGAAAACRMPPPAPIYAMEEDRPQGAVPGRLPFFVEACR